MAAVIRAAFEGSEKLGGAVGFLRFPASRTAPCLKGPRSPDWPKGGAIRLFADRRNDVWPLFVRRASDTVFIGTGYSGREFRNPLRVEVRHVASRLDIVYRNQAGERRRE
jgi:hypothetical protein